MFTFMRDALIWLSGKLNVFAYLTAENLALHQQLIVGARNQIYPRRIDWNRLSSGPLQRIWPSIHEMAYVNMRWELETSRLIELSRVGGLHHRYEWSEAA